MKTRYRRFALWLAAACAFVFALNAVGLLKKQRVFADLAHTKLAFYGDSRVRTADDAYGPMNEGPRLMLPKGEYTLRVTYDGDGDNRVLLGGDNGARIAPSEIALPAGQGVVETTFTVVDAVDRLQFIFVYESGTRFEVRDVRLYSPFYGDLLFASIGLIAAVFGVWLLHLRGVLTPERRGALAVMLLAVLIASGPALKDTISVGHDTNYHLVRLQNLADGLANGQFPVRVGGFSHNGYGAMISVFYPDAFLYPFALMMNMGASIQFALCSLLVAVNLLSALTMYIAARRMFGERNMAVCASVLYTLSVYRLYDVFTRCAVGEMTAMAFLPLFVLGLYEVILGDKSRWAALSVGAAGVFLSHMLSTLICAAAALCACALFIVRIVRQRRLMTLVKAGAMTAALCAFELVPLLMVVLRDGMGIGGMERPLTYFDLHPATLILDYMPIDHTDVHQLQFTIGIGLPLLLAAGLTVFTVAADGMERRGKAALLLLGAGGLFAYAATSLFPWSYAIAATDGAVNLLQFPWRLLMMTTVLLALAGGYGMMRFARAQARPMLALALGVGAIAVLPMLTIEARTTEIIDYGETASPHLLSGEYLLEGSDYEKTLDTSPILTGDVQLTQYDKQSTTIRARVVSGEGGSVTFPLFGFMGYRVTLAGEAVAWHRGENNRVAVDLPAGVEGEIVVRYSAPWPWRVADGVTLASVLALCIRGYKSRRRRNKP